MTDIPFEYRAVKISEHEHAVFVVHEDTPEWWRKVAVFYNATRAEYFADFENSMAQDWWEDKDDQEIRDQDIQLAPRATLPPEPRTAVDIGAIRDHFAPNNYDAFVLTEVDTLAGQAEPFRNATVLGAEVSAPPAKPQLSDDSGQLKPVPPVVVTAPAAPQVAEVVVTPAPKTEDVCVVTVKPGSMLAEMVEGAKPAQAAARPAPEQTPAVLADTATLEPLSERQIRTFEAAVQNAAAGRPMTAREIAKTAGFPNCLDALDVLVKRRYMTRDRNQVPFVFGVIAKGEPRLWVPPALWSDEELKELRELAVPDTYHAFADLKKRGLGGVITMAHKIGCYRTDLNPTKPMAPRAPLPVAGPKPEQNHAKHYDDLSKTQQFVLRTLGVGADFDVVTAERGLSKEDVAVAVNVLRARGCVLASNGKGVISDLGKRLVADMEADVKDVVAAPPAPKAVFDDTPKGHLASDPIPGRSALDRKRAIEELKIAEYLETKGHDCRPIGATGTSFQFDGKVIGLKEALGKVNQHRGKDGLPALSVVQYL